MAALGVRPQLLTSWASPQGCLRVLKTRQLSSLRVNDLGKSKTEAAVSFIA